jgi:hypothetical protein
MSTTYEHSTIGQANELFQHGPLIDYLPQDAPCYVALGDDGACCVVPYGQGFRDDALNADACLREMADRQLHRLRGGGYPRSAPKGPPGVGFSQVRQVQNFSDPRGSKTSRGECP